MTEIKVNFEAMRPSSVFDQNQATTLSLLQLGGKFRSSVWAISEHKESALVLIQ